MSWDGRSSVAGEGEDGEEAGEEEEEGSTRSFILTVTLLPILVSTYLTRNLDDLSRTGK